MVNKLAIKFHSRILAIKLTIPNLHNKRVTGDGDELWLKEGLDGWTNSSSCWFAVEFTRLCFLLTLWLALHVNRVPHNGFGSTKSTLIPLSLSLCMSVSLCLCFIFSLSLSLIHILEVKKSSFMLQRKQFPYLPQCYNDLYDVSQNIS